MFITDETILKLNAILGLNAVGNEQDWEIELADSNRLPDFIDIAKNNDFAQQERYAIMALILASFDDYMNQNGDEEKQIWHNISIILDDEFTVYTDLLKYWAVVDDENIENHFTITPLIRDYLNQT